MKLSREKLKQLVAEELEQEGFFGNLKAKIAPGMAAKSVAKSFGPMFTVNHEGAIEIVPAYAIEVNSGPDGKPDIKRIIDMVFRNTTDMIQDENFQALPEESKNLILKYNKAAKEGKTSGSDAVLKLAPFGSEFRNVIQNIKVGKYKEMSAKAAAADKERKASAAAAKDREEKERSLRNDYESRKNAKLDAELAAKKDKERADQEFRTSQREPEDSRAARPYDGRVSSYSSAPTGNVRDAWEESKKSNKNIVKEGKNRKLTKDRLKQIIKEELEEMMVAEQNSRKAFGIDHMLWSDLVSAMIAKNPAAKKLEAWAGSAEVIHITYLDPQQAKNLGVPQKELFTFWKVDPFSLIERAQNAEQLKQLFQQNGFQLGNSSGNDLVSLLANNPEDASRLKKQLEPAKNNMDFLYALQDKVKQFTEMDKYQKTKQTQDQQPKPPGAPVQERKRR